MASPSLAVSPRDVSNETPPFVDNKISTSDALIGASSVFDTSQRIVFDSPTTSPPLGDVKVNGPDEPLTVTTISSESTPPKPSRAVSLRFMSRATCGIFSELSKLPDKTKGNLGRYLTGLAVGVRTRNSGISPSSGAARAACDPRSRCSHK